MRFRPSYLAQQQLTTYAPQHTDGGSYGCGCASTDASYMGGIFGDPSSFAGPEGSSGAGAPAAPGMSGDPLAMGIQLVGGLITSIAGNRAANKQAKYQLAIEQERSRQAQLQAQAASRSGGGQQAAGVPTWVWVAGGVTALALIGGLGVVAVRRRKGVK